MAKQGIVLYTSRTGYSKRYAEHIAKELDYDIKPLAKANLFSVSCYPTIVYGGGLHHNRIDGFKGIIEGSSYFGEQSLIVFSVGLASMNEDLIKQIRLKNFPDLEAGTFFYHPLPGGLSRADANGTMAEKVAAFKAKRDEGKKLTRGDKIALAIAAGEAAEQNRFDTAACAPLIEAALRHA